MDEATTSQKGQLYDPKSRKRKYPWDIDDYQFDESQVTSSEKDIFPTYEKTQGSGHLYGPEFQYTMCALYALKFCGDERIYDFEITTNNSKYKVFDDIVIDVTLQDGKKMNFLMQLKHGSPQKKLTVGDFARQTLRNKSFLKNHYCLATHLDFIKTIKDDDVICVIFTNNTTSLEENSVIKLDQKSVTVKKCDDFEFIDLLVNVEKTKRDDILVLETNLIGNKTKLYLFSNQDNAQALKLTVEKVLRKLVECDIYDSFDYFMRTWWSSNFILRKSDVIAKLVELSLTPLIMTLSGEKQNSKVTELKKCFNLFSLILVEPSEENLVTKIWGELDLMHKMNLITSEFSFMSLTSDYNNYNWTALCMAALKFGLTAYSIPVEQNTLSFSDKYKIITNLSNLKMNKISWYLDLVPLVVQFNKENKNLIKRCLYLLKLHFIKRKIVLVGNFTVEEIQEVRKDFDIFQNVLDSNDSVLDNFSVSFQDGGEISLKMLLNSDRSLACFIGVRELLEMSQNSLIFSSKNDNLPDLYLLRSISATFLDTRKLIQFCSDAEDFLLIVNCEKNFDIPSAMELSVYLARRETAENVILVTNKCTKSQFDDVCQICGKSVYLVQVFDDKFCILFSKNGDILPLENLAHLNTIEEDNILRTFNYNINLVCGPVGIGKSTLFSRLRQQCPPGFWPIRINLANYNAFLDYEDFLLNCFETDKISNALEKIVKDYFLKSRKIYLFVDGLDELGEESRKLVLNFIKRVSAEGAHVWVSAREDLENEVTKILDVVPLRLEKLNIEQQKEYLYSKLKGNCARIFKTMEIANGNDLLGNPLYLKIIAQETIWDVIDQQIVPINKICQILFDGLLTFLNKKNLYRLEELEIVSLKNCLDEEDFELLVSSMADFTSRLGISLENIFVLYFSALWFSKHIPKLKLLANKFFSQKFQNLRTMFDVILAAEDQNFLQIVYKNIYGVENVSVRDRGGRSILHIVSSYGTYYPAISTNELLPREDQMYTKLLEKLLCNDVDALDSIFNMTPLEYATRCGCLYVVERFLEKFEKLEEYLFEIYDTKTLVFYCCQMGYHKLLKVIVQRNPKVVNKDLLYQAITGAKDEDYIQPRHGNIEIVKFLLTQIDLKDRKDLLRLAYEKKCYDMITLLSTGVTSFDNGDTLLHLAVKYSTLDQTITQIIKNSNFGVNVTNFEGETPLHFACKKGNLDAVKFLLSQGASPNSTTKEGRSVLHYSTMSKNPSINVIKFLLENGADLNARDVNGLTCLQLAQKAGNDALVKLLKQDIGGLFDDFEKKLTVGTAPAEEKMDFQDSLASRLSSSYSQVFKKRPGTVNRGQDYENLLTAYLVLTLITDKEVEDFKISMDDAAFGNFDDIVIHLKTKSGTRIYCLQVKHSGKRIPVTKNHISATRGDFSLSKYFKSSLELLEREKNLKFIVFTSRRFDLCDGDTIKLEDSNYTLKCRESEVNYFLGTSKSSNCFGFDVIEDDDFQYNCFFSKFIICGDQYNYQEMLILLRKEFSTKFNSDDSAYHRFISFLHKWRSHEGKVEMLDKMWMQRLITLLLLTPFIKPISSGSVDEKAELLRDAVWLFDVMIIEEESYDSFRKMWMNVKIDEVEINRLIRKYQLSSEYINKVEDIDEETYSKLLWIANKAPLIIKSNDCIENILEMGWHFKFILVGSLRSEYQSTFCNLSDLERHPDIYNNIVRRFSLSIQGKEEISLDTLISIHNDCRKLITTNVLASMIEGPYQIGGGKEILPEPYIDRCLSEIIIDSKYLDNVGEGTVVLLSAFKETSILESTKNIFFDENEEFEKFCSSKIANVFHHLKFRNSENYEWLESKGGIDDLTPYHINTSFVEEKQIFSIQQQKLNLVAADPGMGKSCFLRNLKNHTSPEFWTTIFTFREFSEICSDLKSGKSLEDVVMSCKLETFEQSIFKLLMSSKKVLFFWDGLDEVSVDNLDIVVDAIQNLRKQGFSQWITCRTHLKQYCEQKFSLFSREMQPLQKDQLVSYLQYRSVPLQHIETFLNYDLLTVPLHLHQFVELFSKTNRFQLLSLVDVYQYFIDSKINSYNKERANIDVDNEFVKKIFETYRKSIMKNFELAAVKALNIDCNLESSIDDYLKDLKEKNDPIGLITLIQDGTPRFIHQSYAEYFAANYLFKNRRDTRNLVDFLFEEKYKGLRLMFDLITAKNSVAHVAVLTKKYEMLESFEDKINDKDLGGRSLLHIASSWGLRYPLLKVDFLENCFIVHDSDDIEVTRETVDYIRVLEYLLEKCDSTEFDDFFKMTPLHYAAKTNNVLARLKIMKKQMKTLSIVDDDAVRMLYYSIKFGWSDIFSLVEDVPVIIDGYKNSLLHLAVKNGKLEILAHLLRFDTLKSVVNSRNGDGRTALHFAVDRGSEEIIKLLVENGADVNC